MFRTITPIFSIVLAVVIYFGFTSGVFTEIREIQAKTAVYQTAIEKGVEYNRKLEDYLNIKRSFSALDMERINAFAPAATDDIHLLVDLEALARKHNMLLGNIEVSEAAAGVAGDSATTNSVTIADFSSADISFGLIGTYEQFRAMLADIEKSLILMEVTNISLAANEGELQQFDLTVRMYSLNQVSPQI